MSSNNINGAEVSKNKDNNYNINSVNNKKNNGSKVWFVFFIRTAAPYADRMHVIVNITEITKGISRTLFKI